MEWNAPTDPALLWFHYCASTLNQPSEAVTVDSAQSSCYTAQLEQVIRQQLTTTTTTSAHGHYQILVTGMNLDPGSSVDANQCCMLDGNSRCKYGHDKSFIYNNTVGPAIDQSLAPDPQATHSYVCDYHNGVLMPSSTGSFTIEEHIRKKKKKKVKKQTVRINLQCLSPKTLNKYIKHFAKSEQRVQINPAFGHAAKAQVLTKHLYSLMIDESSIIEAFTDKVKSLKHNRSPKKNTSKEKKKHFDFFEF